MDRWINYGLVVRWVASLTEMNAFFRIPSSVRAIIFNSFSRQVTNNIAAASHSRLVETKVQSDSMLTSISDCPTVFTFEVTGERNGLNREQLKTIHHCLNTDPKFGYFLGQPVEIGKNKFGLRISIGAPLIIDVATNTSLGATLDHRLTWMRTQVQCVFDAIDSLVQDSLQLTPTSYLTD